MLIRCIAKLTLITAAVAFGFGCKSTKIQPAPLTYQPDVPEVRPVISDEVLSGFFNQKVVLKALEDETAKKMLGVG